MVVISDTSPINYLCQIGQIGVLPRLFGRIVVPFAVANELRQDSTPDSVRRFIGEPPNWLEVRKSTYTGSVIANIGTGEREAIALALELNADLLIVDDLDARAAAGKLQISVIGTLGVLKLAAERTLVDLPNAIDELQAIGFYLSASLKRELLGDGP